ncbi:MAG: hypothetical protein Q8L49_12190 [Burkholderiaceae bacterium]|nr:hypothetical protein [Burkholderiaceae bacterium]
MPQIDLDTLPLLWRDRVIGWGHLTWCNGVLDTKLGYVRGQAPRDAALRRALDDELDRLREFLRP